MWPPFRERASACSVPLYCGWNPSDGPVPCETLEEHARNRMQGFIHATTGRCRSLEVRDAVGIERLLQRFERFDLRQVSFVVLDDPRDRVERQVVLAQVLFEVLQRLQIVVHLAGRRVGHEDHGVGALQHELARRVVEDLTRYRVQQEARAETMDLTELERQEIEEERAILPRLHRDHLAARVAGNAGVDALQVGRLAAQTGPVVDDLRVDLASGVVDEDHSPLPQSRGWL